MGVVLIVYLILTLGYLLGRITIKGLSLGTSGIILVALVIGHFSQNAESIFAISAETMSSIKEVQNFGLACFVASVGFIAGPVFFSNFKKKAFAYIIVGIAIILTGALICVFAIRVLHKPTALTAGLLCGALTSTPGLGAAKEASGDAAAAIGYGIGYPFGVLGVVLFVQLIPRFIKVDVESELAAIRANAKKDDLTDGGKPVKMFEFDPFGMCAFCATIVLGILIGKIKIPLPGGAKFSLGVSGGPLLTSLLVGYLGHIGKVSLKVPVSTTKALRELGLALFLMGAGLEAGRGFVEVLLEHGPSLFLIGIVMTTVPMFVGFFICYKLFRIPTLTSLGSVCGGMTSTPALGSLIAVAGSDEVSVSYAATYPVALICIVLAAQFICVLL